MRNSKTLQGYLLMVQESRFRLATAGGRVWLFSLSHTASVDETDLLELYEAGVPVTIEYQGEPGFDSGIVLAMRPLSRGARPLIDTT